MSINNFKYKKIDISPFKFFVLENFPFIEDDFDSLTSYGLYCKLKQFFSEVANNVNVLGENAESLTNAFNELENYVDNYFENLDIQTEIDSKLDEMAESGELAEIITHYVQLQGLLCFNKLSDLKNATNLVDGSFVKTYGTSNTYDGKGFFYKVRQIVNTDVVDDINIIGLTNYPNLVAERIATNYVKKMIVIGDSYSNNAQSGTPLWYKYIEKWDNLLTYTTSSDGQGYAVGNNNFLTQLQNAKNNVPLDDIDRIYIVGGLNDLGHTDIESFKSALTTTFNYVKNNFPGIKVYVVGILPFQYYNWYTDFLDANKAKNFNAWLGYTTRLYDFIFISCKYFGLNIPDFYGEPNSHGQCHPSSIGEKFIANMIYNNNRVYGFESGTSTKIQDMPLTITNGTNNEITAHINRTDETGINITIDNYDHTQQLVIDNKPFPDFYFVPITDQKGNCDFVYNSSGTIKLQPNTGLEDGTLFIHIPWNWNV